MTVPVIFLCLAFVGCNNPAINDILNGDNPDATFKAGDLGSAQINFNSVTKYNEVSTGNFQFIDTNPGYDNGVLNNGGYGEKYQDKNGGWWVNVPVDQILIGYTYADESGRDGTLVPGGKDCGAFQKDDGNWYITETTVVEPALIGYAYADGSDRDGTLVPGGKDCGAFQKDDGDWCITETTVVQPALIGYTYADGSGRDGTLVLGGKECGAFFNEVDGNWYIKETSYQQIPVYTYKNGDPLEVGKEVFTAEDGSFYVTEDATVTDPGWTSTWANNISYNGKTITGYGSFEGEEISFTFNSTTITLTSSLPLQNAIIVSGKNGTTLVINPDPNTTIANSTKNPLTLGVNTDGTYSATFPNNFLQKGNSTYYYTLYVEVSHPKDTVSTERTDVLLVGTKDVQITHDVRVNQAFDNGSTTTNEVLVNQIMDEGSTTTNEVLVIPDVTDSLPVAIKEVTEKIPVEEKLSQQSVVKVNGTTLGYANFEVDKDNSTLTVTFSILGGLLVPQISYAYGSVSDFTPVGYAQAGINADGNPEFTIPYEAGTGIFIDLNYKFQ